MIIKALKTSYDLLNNLKLFFWLFGFFGIRDLFPEGYKFSLSMVSQVRLHLNFNNKNPPYFPTVLIVKISSILKKYS